MLSVEELQYLSPEELCRIQSENSTILASIHQKQMNSVKGMVIPPVFSYNILKLATLFHQPTAQPKEMTWKKIQKTLLRRFDIFIRKCENIAIYEIPEQQIEVIETEFSQIYSCFGMEIEKKSELYGNFVYRMCQWTIRMRSLMHASKYLKNED